MHTNYSDGVNSMASMQAQGQADIEQSTFQNATLLRGVEQSGMFWSFYPMGSCISHHFCALYLACSTTSLLTI
jgi:hypothetical protein